MTRNPIFLFAILVAALCVGAVIPSQAQKDKRKGQGDVLSTARLHEAEYTFTEGERFSMLEDYAKALFYFQRASDLNPDNAAIYYKIAEVLAKGNKEEDLTKAATSIDNALRLEKKNRYYYLLAANIHASLTHFSKAEQILETMMQEIKGTDEYLYELAAYYQYDHKPLEAIRIYNKAETILGINEVSSLQKQRLYLEQGKLEEAVAEGRKLMETFPEEERYVLGFAEALSQFKQGTKAISFLKDYLHDHPGAGNVKMLLSGLYRENGQEEKSRQLVLESMDDPFLEVGSKVLMLGTYTALLGQAETKKTEDPDLEVFALSLFEKLQTEYPRDPGVHLAGGDLNLTLKRSEAAQKEYRLAIHFGSTSYEAWERLLYLESQGNEFDSLINHTEQALELFPNQAMLHYFNGYAQLRKKHFKEAAASLEQAKRLSANNPNFTSEINSMLGDTYYSTKEYVKSDKAFDEALAVNPDYDLVLNNYSYYLALRKENLEKAEKMSTQLIRRNPTNANFLDTHAWVLYARGKYKDARKAIEKAISMGMAGAAHFEHYGDILFQLGEIDEAVKQWQIAKSLDNGNQLIDKKIANRKLN